MQKLVISTIMSDANPPKKPHSRVAQEATITFYFRKHCAWRKLFSNSRKAHEANANLRARRMKPMPTFVLETKHTGSKKSIIAIFVANAYLSSITHSRKKSPSVICHLALKAKHATSETHGMFQLFAQLTYEDRRKLSFLIFI